MPLNNHYNPRLKDYARQHRNNSTKAEIILWSKLLKNRKMMGYQFLRQRPIDNYIADFFCKELKLIIEADGITHTFEENFEYEIKRTKRLKELGYSILRFNDGEILKDLINVYRTISGNIEIMEEKNPELLELKKRKPMKRI